jgi:ABC-type Fe3+ transport system substrate-binding protein
MDWTKTAVALSIIALVVSAGSLVYTSQMVTSLSQQLAQVSQAASQASELGAAQLYPGEAALYSQAKKEGTVIMYSIWDPGDLSALALAFQKRYPGVTPNFIALDNPTLILRVSQEYQAQKQTVDVIGSDSAPPDLYPLGAIQDYQTVQKSSEIISDPRYPIVSLQVQVLAYNSKLITSADLPKNWEDVTNSKYAGKVAMDNPLRGGPMTWLLVGLKDYWKDDTKWTNFVKGLKALNTPVFQSTSQQSRLLVAGEYELCIPCLSQDILLAKSTGGTVDWIKSIPPILFPRAAAIYKLAPHPNAGKLLAEWLLSSDAAPVWCSLQRTPGRTNVPCPVAVEQLFPGGAGTIPVQVPADPAAWINTNLKPLWPSP